MASENKTKVTGVKVEDFLASFVDQESKREESRELIRLMASWTGEEARMWGPSIIGFGSYRYRYASGREGVVPLLGFSPRKAQFSLYVTEPGCDYGNYVEKLGKVRQTKGCIYFKKMTDLDLAILEKIARKTMQCIADKYPDVKE